MNRERLTAYLAVVVSSVWAVVALWCLVLGEYDALYAVTPVMVAVVGFYFGLRNGNNGNGRKG